MKDEYARVVREEVGKWNYGPYDPALNLATKVAERCEALASKPVRELTDAEIISSFKNSSGIVTYLDRRSLLGMRGVIAAHERLKSEPDEIPFDQKKLDEGGWSVAVHYENGDATISKNGHDEGDRITKVTLVRKT